MWKELAQYRELFWMLAWRDIRVRYKHTLLGALWAVAPPVLTMLVFVFVFRHAMGLSDLTGGVDIPYPLFALCGLVPWTFFSAGLQGAVGSLVANRSLVTKIYFPREVFPIASVLSAAADFLVAWLVFAALMLWYAAQGNWNFQPTTALLALPLVVAVQLTLMIALAFFLSMGNLFYRDVGFVFRGVLPLMMFVTNVVYPLSSADPRINLLIRLNPLVPIIDGYRAALLGIGPLPLGPLTGAAAISVLLLAAGWTLFHRSEYTFAERI